MLLAQYFCQCVEFIHRHPGAVRTTFTLSAMARGWRGHKGLSWRSLTHLVEDALISGHDKLITCGFFCRIIN